MRELSLWLAVAALEFSLGMFVGWLIGFRRGQQLERLELPPHGQFYTHDGYSRRIYADSAVEALAKLVSPRTGGLWE